MNSHTQRLVACILASLTIPFRQDGAITIGGPIINPANGHGYYLLSLDTWDASQAAAEALGGNLVTIDDDAEQVWVFDTFSKFGGTVRNLWIGLNDQVEVGNFVWVGGGTATFRNFPAHGPNNHPDQRTVMIIHPANEQGGKWTDQHSSYTVWQERPINGVVEVEPKEVGPVGLTIAPAVGLRWLAVLGKSYQVQSMSEVTGSVWEDFGAPIQGTGKIETVFDLPSGEARQFYRVVELK